MSRLKVALMGLAGVGEEYLAAIRANDRFELVAIADTDAELLRRRTQEGGERGYEDYRSLVVASDRASLDLLFVALEPHQSLEFIEMAAERNISVFCKAPFARTVREGRRVIERFKKQTASLVVARAGALESALTKVAPIAEQVGEWRAATITVRTTAGAEGWRGDSARAGGGILLHGAYDAVELLIRLLGVPDCVYAQCTSALPTGAPRKYDTEDAVIVSLRFANASIGCVVASRGAASPLQHAAFLAAGGTLELLPHRATVTTPRGEPVEFAVEPGDALGAAIDAFGESLQDEDVPVQSTAEEHLLATAVIEAGYLSQRTGAPESPQQRLG